MKRRLLNLLTALSLLLCVAVCVLWARSYWRTEGLNLTRTLDLVSDNGDLILVAPAALLAEEDDKEPRRPWPRWVSEPRDATEEQDLYMQGFEDVAGRWGFVIGPTKFFGARVYAVAPWWSAAALFALTPLLRASVAVAVRVRRARRARHGKCASCGYDLTATPDRCPECGTTP